MDNIKQVLEYIHLFGMFSKKKPCDLSKMKYLCNLFGNPQNSFLAVHITGTNGKGSACAMCANIFKEFGLRTGLYISPYIVNFNERISVDGSDIPDEDLILYANIIKNKFEETELPEEFMPNEFEFNTLLAFLYFRNMSIEIAVIEVGLGGRLDPTNVIPPPLASVIMSVSLDHTEILGENVEDIAIEKSGIIKKNSCAVLYPLNKESVIDIIKNKADKENSEFILPEIAELEIIETNINYNIIVYRGIEYKVSLSGIHQVYNALTVIELFSYLSRLKLLNHFDLNFIKQSVKKGLESTYFQARFEILSNNPLMIFDGAHNVSGITTLESSIKILLKNKSLTFVCGMLKDKNPEVVLASICRLAKKIYTVPVASPRAIKPEKLSEIISNFNENVSSCSDIKVLCKELYENIGQNEAVVFFGSLYLAADVKSAISTLNKVSRKDF